MNQEIVPVTHNWTDILNVWLDTKTSPRTRTEYRKAVAEAIEYIGGMEKVSKATLARYHRVLLHGLESGSLSSNTVALRLSALRGFLHFAGVPDELLRDTLKRPTVGTDKPYNILSDTDIAKLIAACSNVRDRALICLLRETGLRCDELCNLKESDVYKNDSGIVFVRVRKGKGNKVRDVPLSPKAQDAVQSALADPSHEPGNDAYLLQSRERGRLSNSRVRQIIIDARTAAGLKDVSAHSLRHTAAIRWIKKGARVNAVGKLLGHSSLTTTTRYLDHLDLAELAEVVG